MTEIIAPDRMTERDVLDLLNLRYGKLAGNGARYVGAEHVRSAAGFDALRTADYIAMDLWPSKGLALHGHEVKVSRSDWLAELKQPEKSAEFTPYMTFWWLVVSDRSVVRDGELPDGWGLLEPGYPDLRIVKPARKNPAPEPLPRTMLAALLRATARTARASEGRAIPEPTEGQNP
ncbi:hypothetical protein ACIOD2_32245 [Amycolatopsis sp. NPDC088138]|uniref:hypothetical protein n=1 Tax=Amycolatopsis sp. NPDC088138 TaxID=3363938 RepID=UPI00381749C0